MSLVSWMLNELLDDHHRRPKDGKLHDQHFGVHHNPQAITHPQKLNVGSLKSGYVRPWRSNPADSGVSSIINNKNEFAINLDVPHFRPEELKVSVKNDFLIIEGNHGERLDEHGYISRQFTRSYHIPEDVDQEAITSSISSDNILCLSAPKKTAAEAKREIPITATNEPAKNTKKDALEKMDA